MLHMEKILIKGLIACIVLLAVYMAVFHGERAEDIRQGLCQFYRLECHMPVGIK